jgi:predicted DCC family thiol-disulfide oxidoreductase YuxK
MNNIILFDGLCNFCDNSVQFIIKRDPKGHYKFASLQSETGKRYIKKFGLKDDLSSIVLIEDDKYFVKSTAVLRICRKLSGLWKVLTVFRVIPVPVRDYFYRILASNRYKWFGRKESCIIPSPEIRTRFLD